MTQVARPHHRIAAHGGREQAGMLRAMVRAGWIAKAAVYVLLGWLVIQLATGDTSQQPNAVGALEHLASTGPGTLALWALGIGLAAHSVGRLLEVTVLARPEVDGKDLGAGVALAVAYAAFAVSAFAIAAGSGPSGSAAPTGGSASGSSTESAQRGTSLALGLPGGRLLVGLAALAFFALAGSALHSGVAQRFLDTLETGEMRAALRRWAAAIGTAAYATRAVIFGLLGWFLAHAALTHDPQDAKGLDGALREVAEAPWGTPLLIAIAAGLVMYGLFALTEARHRRIGTSATGS